MPNNASALPARIAPETALGGRRPRFFYLVSLPLWIAAVIRSFDSEGDAGRRPLTFVLLLAYLVLFVTGDRLSRRYSWYEDAYFGLQLGVVFGTMVAQPDLDFFPVLLIPVSAQIALVPDRSRRRFWFAATFTVMAGGLLVFQDFPRSVALMLLYGAGYFLIASYASVTEQEERAEAQARALVVELQDANQQLTENAATIESLAIVEERNRLARELHDSVSQSLYGLVLSSEAARRNLASGNLESIAGELDAMTEAAYAAQAEMRLLIYELRPPEVEEHGLQRALETRLATVERRAGLQTELVYDVTGDLPLRTEIELERIATEALTNAVRHSAATEVRVEVRKSDNVVLLDVLDNGSGFDPGTAATGFGLRGMRERAERIGGTLSIESIPGQGTRVRVEGPL
jgi:signal transduction histidine kinase